MTDLMSLAGESGPASAHDPLLGSAQSTSGGGGGGAISIMPTVVVAIPVPAATQRPANPFRSGGSGGGCIAEPIVSSETDPLLRPLQKKDGVFVDAKGQNGNGHPSNEWYPPITRDSYYRSPDTLGCLKSSSSVCAACASTGGFIVSLIQLAYWSYDRHEVAENCPALYTVVLVGVIETLSLLSFFGFVIAIGCTLIACVVCCERCARRLSRHDWLLIPLGIINMLVVLGSFATGLYAAIKLAFREPADDPCYTSANRLWLITVVLSYFVVGTIFCGCVYCWSEGINDWLRSRFHSEPSYVRDQAINNMTQYSQQMFNRTVLIASRTGGGARGVVACIHATALIQSAAAAAELEAYKRALKESQRPRVQPTSAEHPGSAPEPRLAAEMVGPDAVGGWAVQFEPDVQVTHGPFGRRRRPPHMSEYAVFEELTSPSHGRVALNFKLRELVRPGGWASQFLGTFAQPVAVPKPTAATAGDTFHAAANRAVIQDTERILAILESQQPPAFPPQPAARPAPVGVAAGGAAAVVPADPALVGTISRPVPNKPKAIDIEQLKLSEEKQRAEAVNRHLPAAAALASAEATGLGFSRFGVDVLQLILSAVGPGDMQDLSRVCRHWYRVVNSDSMIAAFWGNLTGQRKRDPLLSLLACKRVLVYAARSRHSLDALFQYQATNPLHELANPMPQQDYKFSGWEISPNTAVKYQTFRPDTSVQVIMFPLTDLLLPSNPALLNELAYRRARTAYTTPAYRRPYFSEAELIAGTVHSGAPQQASASGDVKSKSRKAADVAIDVAPSASSSAAVPNAASRRRPQSGDDVQVIDLEDYGSRGGAYIGPFGSPLNVDTRTAASDKSGRDRQRPTPLPATASPASAGGGVMSGVDSLRTQLAFACAPSYDHRSSGYNNGPTYSAVVVWLTHRTEFVKQLQSDPQARARFEAQFPNYRLSDARTGWKDEAKRLIAYSITFPVVERARPLRGANPLRMRMGPAPAIGKVRAPAQAQAPVQRYAEAVDLKQQPEIKTGAAPAPAPAAAPAVPGGAARVNVRSRSASDLLTPQQRMVDVKSDSKSDDAVAAPPPSFWNDLHRTCAPYDFGIERTLVDGEFNDTDRALNAVRNYITRFVEGRSANQFDLTPEAGKNRLRKAGPTSPVLDDQFTSLSTSQQRRTLRVWVSNGRAGVDDHIVNPPPLNSAASIATTPGAASPSSPTADSSTTSGGDVKDAAAAAAAAHAADGMDWKSWSTEYQMPGGNVAGGPMPASRPTAERLLKEAVSFPPRMTIGSNVSFAARINALLTLRPNTA